MALTIGGGITIGGAISVQLEFPPGVPTIGTATATGTTTATVAFTAPSYTGSSTITSYTATSSPGNITGTLNQAGSGTINITGLTSSTSYTFTVTATNAIGTSSASNASNSITTTSPQDSYFMYNSLLLPGNGTNTAQNNTFLDGSTNNFAITRAGNTTQGTFSPYGGNWSNYFDGTGDMLGLAPNTALDLTGDFTIEAWVNITTGGFIINKGGGSNIAWASYELVASGTDIWFAASSANNGYDIGGENATGKIGSFTPGQWTHIAVTRSGNIYRGFVNGVQGYTQTLSLTPYTTSDRGLNIGASYQNSWGVVGNIYQVLTGYISNLRIVKGTAVYTSAFTPPTIPLTPITNTSLLTCQTNSLIDNSTNNFTITKNGDTSVQRFSPFSPSSLTPTSYSGYFDGTGDVLTPPANNVFAFGTDSFCIEAWIFNNVLKNYSCLVTTRPNNGNYADAYHIGWDSVGGVSLYVNSTSTTGAPPGTITTGQWQHFVCCRDSSNRTAIFVNGTRVGNDTVTSNFTRNLLGIGDFPTTPAEGINGYISNLRLVKGNSVYDPTQTTITVPTSPLTTTSQGVTASTVSILTCQSPTFIDNSTNNFTITAVGNTKPIQQNPFGFTSATTEGYTVNTIGGSGYFDGSGDYLTIARSNLLIPVANENFTIESWVYLTQAADQQIVGFHTQGVSSDWVMTISSTNYPTFYISATATTMTSSIAVRLNTWNHIAVVRTNTNTITLYVNGVAGATTTTTSTMVGNGSNPLTIGSDYNGVNWRYMGYISDIRIVKGTAVYTSAFTPPTAPVTAVANTQLLTNYTNAGITDSSMINNLETVGNAQISTAQSKFGGGRMSFDGTGDWLIAPRWTGINASENLTMETWIYMTASPSTLRMIVSDLNASNANQSTYWTITTSGMSAQFGTSAETSANGTFSFSANTWYYIALVRNSNVISMYVNGTSISMANSSQSASFLTNSSILYVGRWGGSPAYEYIGYINDLRITRGIARYTSNFAPPTTAFPTY